MGFAKDDFPLDVVALDLRQYNGFNQLVTVEQDSEITSYSYRPDGLRHSKTSKANTVTHYWDGQNIVAEANANGNIRGKYLRGINLIAQEIDNQSWYYTHNAHGDVIQRIRDNGEAAPVYHYDAFGNERNPVDTDPNLFRYCAEYWDRETESYYLRARCYVPRVGRFTQEDPIESGLNWYVYCGGNPILFVDPLGLERIVVSGGRYSSKKGYQYEFVDSALKEIMSYKGEEKSTLAIATGGFTDEDLARVNDLAEAYGFNVFTFDDVSQLTDYINSGSDNNRVGDEISRFRVFSHGYEGSIEFGHGIATSDAKEKLSWTIEKLSALDKNAFQKTDSLFYACNTGTTFNGTSFAQEWSNITGGKTKAALGTTWYGDINSFSLIRADSWLVHRTLRDLGGGYNLPHPAFRRPVASEGVKWQTFKPN